MKKQYEKPRIVFEGFELSQSIAAGCSLISNFLPYACSIDIGIGNVYTEDNCEDTPGPGDDICYDVPDGSNVVFSS